MNLQQDLILKNGCDSVISLVLWEKRIVLLSTHIVSDIEYIADCILMMKNGELIRQGTENEVIADVQGYVWKCVVPECEVQGLNENMW